MKMVDLRKVYPGGLYSLRNLSSVPRWSIVKIQIEQSVSDHVFQASMLFKVLAHKAGLSPTQRCHGYEWMLTHDTAEALTSDVPSVCKNEWWSLIEDAVSEEIVSACAPLLVNNSEPDKLTHWLCLVADVLEAYLKCFDELMAGNLWVCGGLNTTELQLGKLLADSPVGGLAATDYVLRVMGECSKLLE